MTDAKAALDKLTADIEALSDQRPMWSKSAYTHHFTAHVAFANGEIRVEGSACAPTRGSLTKDIEATLAAVQTYRKTIKGAANLVWRVEPRLEENADGSVVYCRLCFEPAA